jgi:hypothetical protein
MEVSKELVQLSHPPSHKAYTYDSMWAYGNHYWVDPYDGYPSHAMYNSRVACIFIQASHSLAWDPKHNSCIFTICGNVEGDCCGELFGTLISYVHMFLDSSKCSWKHKNNLTRWKWILDGQFPTLIPTHGGTLHVPCACVSSITKPLLICNVGRHLLNNIRKNLSPNH